MNSDPPYTIYPSKEAAMADGVPENKIVTGDLEALQKLQSKLLAGSRRKRMRMRPRGSGRR